MTRDVRLDRVSEVESRSKWEFGQIFVGKRFGERDLVRREREELVDV